MKRIFVLLVIGTVLAGTHGAGQVPQKISYQGLLTQAPGGATVPNGSYTLKFEIYDALTGGTLQYSDTLAGVAVTRGTFNVTLGPLPGIFTKPLYVQVTVLSGPGVGSAATFSPRSELSSAPYALAPWLINGSSIFYTLGNVGIGTATPLSQLHVRGNNPVRILGDLSTLAGSEYVDFMARNSPYSTDIGGMRVQRDSATGNVNTMIFAAADGFPASEKMRIVGNGNVGIGTSNPTSRLEIAAQDGLAITGYQPFLTLRDANASNWRGVIQSVQGGLDFLAQHYLDATDPSSYVGMDMWGDIGIRTAPAGYYSLHVAPSGGFYSAYIEGSIADGIALYANNQAAPNYGGQTNTAIEGDAEDANNNWAIYGHANGGSNNYGGYFEGDLVYTGSFIHASDANLKENIQSYSGALSQIMNLTPRTFNYRSGPEYRGFSFSPGKHYGFIAQEVEKVIPDLVVTAVKPPERDAKGNLKVKPTEYKAIKPVEMISILVEAMQEQQKLINELRAKVDRLESK